MNKKAILAGAALLIAAPAALGQGQIKTYQWQGSLFLPDNDPTFSFVDIVVGDAGAIEDIDVGFLVSSTWQGDLILEIEHLDTGTRVPLIYRPGDSDGGGVGFSADNLGDAASGREFVLDDEANEAYDSDIGWGTIPDPGINNVAGNWIPYGQFDAGGIGGLNAFDGEDKRGTWRIYASDNAGGDDNILNQVTLYVTNVPAPGALALLGFAGLVARRRRRA